MDGKPGEKFNSEYKISKWTLILTHKDTFISSIEH